MSAWPTARTSPTAGLFNALVRLVIARLNSRIAELRLLIAAETEYGHATRTARNYADSDRSGYIDRTGLETP